MSGKLILGGGAALLLLLSGKKKKSTADASGSAKTDTEHGGGTLDEPLGKKGKRGGTKSGGGSTSGKGRGGGVPANLADDAIWVSPDCKKVVFGDETGEAFWEKKGRPTAQRFIDANYHDPYEVAKLMIRSVAPCAIEFPVEEDGFDPMEEEFRRELFNRDFKDVYYLIQFLHNKISEMMDREEFLIEFADNCDIEFVGEVWSDFVAKRMARFYVGYMYPAAHEFDHAQKYKAWPLADVDEKNMVWWDNVATAIINRMHPECGIALVEAFKKEPWTAGSFFSERPGLKALYDQLVALVNAVDDQQEGILDFDTFDKIQD